MCARADRFQDLHRFDLASRAWAELGLAAVGGDPPPAARRGPGMAAWGVSVFVYGGQPFVAGDDTVGGV